MENIREISQNIGDLIIYPFQKTESVIDKFQRQNHRRASGRTEAEETVAKSAENISSEIKHSDV